MKHLLCQVAHAIRTEEYQSLRGFLSVGAFRVVVEHPSDRHQVIKVAKSRFGRKDNRFEAGLSLRPEVARYFPKVTGASSDYSWITEVRYEPIHDCVEYTEVAHEFLDLTIPWDKILETHFPPEALSIMNDTEKWNFGIAREAKGYRLVCLDPYSTWASSDKRRAKALAERMKRAI